MLRIIVETQMGAQEGHGATPQSLQITCSGITVTYLDVVGMQGLVNWKYCNVCYLTVATTLMFLK